MSDETMNTTADADVVALINEVLGDHWDRTERTAGGLYAYLWATLTETGLHLLTGSEAHGGAEAGWAEHARKYEERVEVPSMAEAIQYRRIDAKYWGDQHA